jgi:deoxycytidylate deaminase
MRFIEAFFGKTDTTPRKDEYGMYAARSASLRSADLSRQVGAAICSKNGDLLVPGCNEVPKAGGGMYWDGELPDHGDIRKGFDPNRLCQMGCRTPRTCSVATSSTGMAQSDA